MVQFKLPLRSPEMDCPLWQGCTAPLCPLSPNLKQAVWFPGEPVCRAESFKDLHWLRIQAEIARLPNRSSRGYFTVAALKAIRQVRPDLTGKKEGAPEKPDPAAKKKRHPSRPATKSTPLKKRLRPVLAPKKSKAQEKRKPPGRDKRHGSRPTASNRSVKNQRRPKSGLAARKNVAQNRKLPAKKRLLQRRQTGNSRSVRNPGKAQPRLTTREIRVQGKLKPPERKKRRGSSFSPQRGRRPNSPESRVPGRESK